VPNFDQSGLTLRTFRRSEPMALSRQPCSISIGSSLARPLAMASASFSAASMPESTAL